MAAATRADAERCRLMSDGLVGIIGGTGLGEALGRHISKAKLYNPLTPFGRSSSPILVGRVGRREVAFLNRHGKGHKLSPSEVPYTANIFALKKLGATSVIASGAVGSLRRQIHPRDLVIPDQVIDRTFRRQSTFFSGFGAVHCEMAQPFCGRIRSVFIEAAKNIGARTHPNGTYVCMEGPQFSTRAESIMHRAWGGDLIGMTAMPEAKLTREAQMCYALVALVSDYDCWQPRAAHRAGHNKRTLLEEIIANLQAATDNAVRLIRMVLESDCPLCCEDCACRKSLRLAVWTDPRAINRAERKKLDILFR